MKKIILFIFLLTSLLFGQSVYFDGDDTAKEAVANYRSSDTIGSFVAWVYFETLNAPATYYVFFGSGDEGSANYNFYIYARYEADTNHYLAVVSEVAGNSDGVRGSTALQTGQWYHIVVTTTDSEWKLYVDGSLDNLTVFSGSNTGEWFGDVINRDNLTFGYGLQNAILADELIGYIDEIGLFSDSLSATDVTTYYNSGTCAYDLTNETNLVGYWKMNEGTGTTLTDAVSGTVVLDFAASTNDPSWSLAQPFDSTLYYVDADKGDDTYVDSLA